MASKQSVVPIPSVSGQPALKPARKQSPRSLSLTRIALVAALVAVVAAYAVVIAAPRWHQRAIEHATIQQLTGMCADGADTAACATLGQRLIAARQPADAIAPLKRSADRLDARPDGVKPDQKALVYGTLAEALMLAGGRDEANKYFTKAIRLDINDVPGHLAFALWLEGLRATALAKNELTLVTTLEPRNDMAWFLLAHIYNGENDLQKSYDAAKKAIAINPRMPNYWQELGDSFGYGGHYRESLPAYREELRLDPANSGAQADVARALALGASTPEEYQEAYDRLTTVMRQRDLNNAAAYYLLGSLQLKFGHYKEARAALEKCVAMDKTLPENFYSLALARKLSGDLKGSKEAMDHFNLMETHFRHTQTLQKQLSEHKNDPELHRQVAQEWEWYHNWPDALLEYKKVLENKPGDAMATQKVQQISAKIVNRPATPIDPIVARLQNVNHVVSLQDKHGVEGYPAPVTLPGGQR